MYHLSLCEKLGNSSVVTPKIRDTGLQGRTETKDGITHTCRRDVDANRQCPRLPTLIDTQDVANVVCGNWVWLCN